MKDNKYYMQLALDLAKKGRYYAAPNPMVGCVIVKNNEIIARGYHQKFGGNHAEINALKSINFKAKNCDIYITLEPCSHTGKTPPCVDSIIKSQPAKVIIASLDPNPKISSIKKMQQANIKVITGILTAEASELNRGFFKRMQTGLPFVSCKIATSLDGRTALENGSSKWITNHLARADVQELRATNQALISGSGTTLVDNPSFSVRDNNKPSPIKIIMDRNGNITNKNLNIFNNAEVILTAKTPLEILQILGKKEVNNVLIEAGSRINNAFLQANLIDEIIIYQAPILLGNGKPMFDFTINAIKAKYTLEITKTTKLETNTKIVAKIINPQS